MTFSQFLTILRARWISGVVVFLIAVVGTVVVTLLMPKNYTATASVLVDLKSPDPMIGQMTATVITPGYMATQADLIVSERVARKAIATLGLTQSTQLRTQWQEETSGVGDFNAWLAGALAKKLEIQPSRDSNVLSISYTSGDPAFSAAVANAYVRGYLSTMLELRTEPARQYSTFFDDRASKFRDDLEAAQNRLSAYQREKGIIASDERLDIENMRLAEISSQVVALETAAMEASSRLGQAGATPERMQEVLNNPVVSTLQADLSRQETRLREITTRLGEANPQVIEARNSIAELRSKLQAAVQRASGSVTVSSNVAQQRLGQLRASREEQRAKVLRLKGSRDELTVLQRDVENAQRAYDAVILRANQTGLESQVTQTNVSVVKDATPPPDSSSPRVLLNTGLAVVFGIVLGLAIALVRELLDPRLRTADDVTRVLKQPLLMVMPRPPAEKKRLRDAARQVQQRLSGGRSQAVAVR